VIKLQFGAAKTKGFTLWLPPAEIWLAPTWATPPVSDLGLAKVIRFQWAGASTTAGVSPLPKSGSKPRSHEPVCFWP